GNAVYAKVADILDPYLSSNQVQIIALTDVPTFHSTLSSNPMITQRFERLAVDALTADEQLQLAEEVIGSLESRYNTFFTYQAVLTLVRGAEQYFQSDLISDKVIDLVTEVVPWAASRQHQLITKAVA